MLTNREWALIGVADLMMISLFWPLKVIDGRMPIFVSQISLCVVAICVVTLWFKKPRLEMTPYTKENPWGEKMRAHTFAADKSPCHCEKCKGKAW